MHSTLSKRLDCKILIKTSDSQNKSIIPESDHPVLRNSRTGVDGKIESNFNKDLLSFSVEITSFGEHQNIAGPNFGNRVEEIIS